MFQQRNHSQLHFYACIAILTCLAVLGLLVPLPKGTRNSSIKSSFAHYKIRQHGNLPMTFEPNRHQFNQEFEFRGSGSNHEVLLKPDAAVLKMFARDGSRRVQLRYRGANTRAAMRGVEALPGEANYFSGSRENWITHVPLFRKVYVDDVYP